MTAIILAAGVGKRLLAASGGRPKCLVEIGGKSLLVRLIDNLGEAGVRDAVVVTGFGADAVQSAVGTAVGGVRVRCIVNPR
ncbi:MAG: nucleotidyltransferase, partial [Deltaproteobacteria bacterium]